ncbi:MAG TPA: glutathione ABC transporter permease GsiD, partial [Anaerolineae bacterium]
PYLRQAWWMAVFPGIAISLVVLSFNILGDALNDALNPRLQETA